MKGLTEMAVMAAIAANRIVVDRARFLSDNPLYADLIDALETRNRVGPLFGDLWTAMEATYAHLGNHPFSHSYQVRTGCRNEEEHALSRLCHAADREDIDLLLLRALKATGDHPKRGQEFLATMGNLDAIRAELVEERRQREQRRAAATSRK